MSRIQEVLTKIYEASDAYDAPLMKKNTEAWVTKASANNNVSEIDNVLLNIEVFKLKLFAAVELAEQTYKYRDKLLMWNGFREQCCKEFGRSHFSHLRTW